MYILKQSYWLYFFLMNFVYPILVAVKGKIKGLITCKYPREHLLAPDVLIDIEKKKEIRMQTPWEVKISPFHDNLNDYTKR